MPNLVGVRSRAAQGELDDEALLEMYSGEGG